MIIELPRIAAGATGKWLATMVKVHRPTIIRHSTNGQHGCRSECQHENKEQSGRCGRGHGLAGGCREHRHGDERATSEQGRRKGKSASSVGGDEERERHKSCAARVRYKGAPRLGPASPSNSSCRYEPDELASISAVARRRGAREMIRSVDTPGHVRIFVLPAQARPGATATDKKV